MRDLSPQDFHTRLKRIACAREAQVGSLDFSFIAALALQAYQGAEAAGDSLAAAEQRALAALRARAAP